MKSLYRRCRPLTLRDVVGQPQVTEPLIKSLEQGKISHAYLFIGPRGCGKTSVARILAHEVNGFKYEIEDDYVDIVEIDGASNRGIDNIRELREKAAIAPTSGKYKIYIIDEVHMLTKEAFNALLKTLEEPPAHVIFIMATTDAYRVPVTITSRAQTYTFKLADTETMFRYLKGVAEKEKIKIDDEALKIIVKRGEGSFRDSLSLLDQISTLSQETITKDMVVSAMGLPEDEKINELLIEYASGNVVKITTILRDLLASGVKAETLTEELIRTIINEPKPEYLSLLGKLTDVKAPFAEAKLLVALSNKTLNTSSFVRRLESEKSHTLVRRENRPTDEPLGDVRNIDFSDSNQKILTKEDVFTPSKTTAFDWRGYLEKVKGLNEAVYLQLKKCRFEFNNQELEIYPEKKIVKTILARDNNKKILIDAGGGVKITIHEIGETPRQMKKDETLDRISDIMGGEVKNDGGGSPF
ncbi:DNA polymerase III subunit gamma/tau [Candidatus Saccharibacteria bacterium]|nr:DNA polymerase III subunit gamma/tau [Candidatus Saccharibacteria bacterium]